MRSALDDLAAPVPLPLATDPAAEVACVPPPDVSAAEAGLRYVADGTPGIARRRADKGFVYPHPDRSRVTDVETLGRIKALAIPPAWTQVWICADPLGHLQATGRDAKGRKQYRYHARFRAVREEAKFGHLLAFARALPRLRAAIDQDSKGPPTARRTILATIVRLLETTLMRVGNEEYAAQNATFGLTTLRKHHVALGGTTLRFEFVGKAGKPHRTELRDRRVARVIRRLLDLPGQRLFKYRDPERGPAEIASEDVNDYLREVCAGPFSAKEFRTWSACVLCAQALRAAEPVSTKAAAKRAVTTAITSVSRRLGNTPSVCRKSYVHPAIVEAYLEGQLPEALGGGDAADLPGLTEDERAVLAFLEARANA